MWRWSKNTDTSLDSDTVKRLNAHCSSISLVGTVWISVRLSLRVTTSLQHSTHRPRHIPALSTTLQLPHQAVQKWNTAVYICNAVHNKKYDITLTVSLTTSSFPDSISTFPQLLVNFLTSPLTAVKFSGIPQFSTDKWSPCILHCTRMDKTAGVDATWNRCHIYTFRKVSQWWQTLRKSCGESLSVHRFRILSLTPTSSWTCQGWLELNLCKQQGVQYHKQEHTRE